MTHTLHSLFLSGSDVNVDFDMSFLAQLALFGLFVVLIKPILLDPLMKLFEEREKRTDGARASARKMDERAAEILKRFEQEIELVRREAAVERETLRAETAKLEARIMDQAKADAQRILETGRARITSEMATLKTELEAARPALAEQIATKLLGREVRS
jgi:F-type H+-transporting ATPase subunit b